jgi:hypothetical protein
MEVSKLIVKQDGSFISILDDNGNQTGHFGPSGILKGFTSTHIVTQDNSNWVYIYDGRGIQVGMCGAPGKVVSVSDAGILCEEGSFTRRYDFTGQDKGII